MTGSRTATDMGVGIALVFATLAVVAALATTATGYLYALDGDHLMQTASGIAVAASMAFAGLAILALHRFGE